MTRYGLIGSRSPTSSDNDKNNPNDSDSHNNEHGGDGKPMEIHNDGVDDLVYSFSHISLASPPQVHPAPVAAPLYTLAANIPTKPPARVEVGPQETVVRGEEATSRGMDSQKTVVDEQQTDTDPQMGDAQDTVPAPEFNPTPASFSDRYEPIQTLMSSELEPVYLVKKRVDKQFFVLKQLKQRKKNNSLFHTPLEIVVIRDVLNKHPNIIKIHEVMVDAATSAIPVYNMVVDWCELGDVDEFINTLHARREPMPKEFIFHFATSMVHALAFLHCGWHHISGYIPEDQAPPAVLHKDIKPANVFMRWRGGEFGLPQLVLGDFGFATGEAKDSHKPCGTECYMAPEVEHAFLQDDDYAPHVMTQASDVWCFGVSLYEVMTMQNFSRSFLETGICDIESDFNHSPAWDEVNILLMLRHTIVWNPQRRASIMQFRRGSSILRHNLMRWYQAKNRLHDHIWPRPAVTDPSGKDWRRPSPNLPE